MNTENLSVETAFYIYQKLRTKILVDVRPTQYPDPNKKSYIFVSRANGSKNYHLVKWGLSEDKCFKFMTYDQFCQFYGISTDDKATTDFELPQPRKIFYIGWGRICYNPSILSGEVSFWLDKNKAGDYFNEIFTDIAINKGELIK